jgi:hypothetical protein
MTGLDDERVFTCRTDLGRRSRVAVVVTDVGLGLSRIAQRPRLARS